MSDRKAIEGRIRGMQSCMASHIITFNVWSLIFSHQHLREQREGGRIKGENVARTDKRRGEGGVEVRGEKHEINCLKKCLIIVATPPTFVLEYITRAGGSSQAGPVLAGPLFHSKKKKFLVGFHQLYHG